MPNTEAIRWFKSNFGEDITRETQGKPYTVDLLTALACQETGYIWNELRKKVPTAEVLRLCIGDTLDASAGRGAFPKTRAELEAHPNGTTMFRIARELLVEMSKYIGGYSGAVRNANKFCHGFGIFQYDLQFFKTDPSYFLEQKWSRFDETLRKAISELDSKLHKLQRQGHISGSSALSEDDLIKVAIAYNTGGYNPAKGLKQGHRSSDGVYYGEAIQRFLRLSRQVANDLQPTTPVQPSTDRVTRRMIVSANSTLKVRTTPDTTSERNVIAALPKGHVVTPISDGMVNGFWEIETKVRGNTLKGFVSGRYLKSTA
jgi:hypothetical protein